MNYSSGFGVLRRMGIAEKISVALFTFGMSFTAQATYCVQGTLCYPDPADICGPPGPGWCGIGDTSEAPQQPYTINIPHMRDNPYPVICGQSDNGQILRSLAWDLLEFSRLNGYRHIYGSPPYEVADYDTQYFMNFSDGSFVELFNGSVQAPGEYDPAMFNNPIGAYTAPPSGYFANVPMAELHLGPDANGYAFIIEHVGLVDSRNPNVSPPPLCIRPFT